MSARRQYATVDITPTPQSHAPLAGLHAIRDDVRVNRIRYPYPNRLGLIKPTPYAETIGGRVIDNGKGA